MLLHWAVEKDKQIFRTQGNQKLNCVPRRLVERGSTRVEYEFFIPAATLATTTEGCSRLEAWSFQSFQAFSQIQVWLA